MTDVLKLAEEALDDLLPPVTYTLLSEPEQRGYAAIEAIRAARAEWGWRPIDSAPKDQTIDAWSEANGRTPDAEWLERYGWCYHGFDDMEVYGYHRIIPQPTHWTPIPAPPKEASDAE